MDKSNFTPTIFILFITGPVISTSPLFSKTVMYKKPEIWLNSYIAVDSFRGIYPDSQFRSEYQFQNEYVSKNGSDYIVSPDTKAIAFSCAAEYPVTWTFPFPEQLESVHPNHFYSQDYRISEFDSDSLEPANLRFKISLSIEFSNEEFFSANITCSSVETKPQLESSVYIYLTGKSSLENEGETLHLSLVEPSSTNGDMRELSPLELPCRPASPNIKLLLEKAIVSSNDNITAWHSLPLFGDSSFDPKIGFTLQRDDFDGNGIFGVYRCSVLDDDNGVEVATDQFVVVNVTKEMSNNNNPGEHEAGTEMPFEPRSSIGGKSSVRLEVHQETGFLLPKITCCSGVKDKPPHLYVHYCFGQLQCGRVKETFLEDASAKISKEHEEIPTHQLIALNVSSDCRDEMLYASSTFVMCQGENIEFVEQFINSFHPLAGGPVTNRSEKILQANQIEESLVNATDHQMTSLSQFESSATMQSAVAAQKMIVVFGANIRITKGVLQRKNIGPPIHFPARHSDVNSDLLYSQDELGIFEQDNNMVIKRKQYVSLLEYDRDEYYEGEPIVPMCFGVRFYYARGPHLRLNWSNGTRTLLETGTNKNAFRITAKEKAHILFLSGNADMFEGDTANFISIFGPTLIARLGMSSVDCWMPQINSSKWDMISKSVQVLPSVLPRFAEKEEETVYFYLGDERNAITCTLKEGRPFPRVSVTRDGRRQKLIIEESWAETQKRLKESEGNNATRDTESINEKKHLYTITISFSTVVHTHQGEIQCIAKNINGTAIRTIKIFVLEKTSKAFLVSLSFVGISCLLLIGLGAKHWHRKRTVQSIQANNI